MRKVCVPSALSYQPSNAGVTLPPNFLGGALGSSVCAATAAPQTRSPSGAIKRKVVVRFMTSSRPLLLVLGRGGPGLVRLDPCFVLGVGDVHDVHPRVRHLVHGAVAPSHPLIGIGVALVILGVVVPG